MAAWFWHGGLGLARDGRPSWLRRHTPPSVTHTDRKSAPCQLKLSLPVSCVDLVAPDERRRQKQPSRGCGGRQGGVFNMKISCQSKAPTWPGPCHVHGSDAVICRYLRRDGVSLPGLGRVRHRPQARRDVAQGCEAISHDGGAGLEWEGGGGGGGGAGAGEIKR